MAQQQYLLDLRLTQFPMLAEQQSRTIIGTSAGEAPNIDVRPRLTYCHNVMPTDYGFRSVGYLPQLPAISPAVTVVDVRLVFDSAGNRKYLAFSNQGAVYFASSLSDVWTPLISTFFVDVAFSPDKLTEGRVDGVTYLYYANKGAAVFDASISSIVPVTLAGLVAENTIGIAGTSGYLLAYTSDSIAWSSTIDPTDFVPDKVTGAGGGRVANIAGAIRYVTANTLGALIYTEANTVAATYTGNAQFPFKFREIPASRGAAALDLIAYEANSVEQFVYSNVGLRTVTSNSSEALLPEVTDFLAGGVIEDFDAATNTFVPTSVTGPLKKKVKYIASRYLVISYGVTSFTHALVYDLALRKVGKLKVDHVDVVDYIADQAEIARESIGIVAADGALQVVDMSADANVTDAVAVLGKLQLSRTRGVQLLAVEAENVQPEDNFTLTDLVSYNGKTLDIAVTGTLQSSVEDYRKYNFRTTGKNHTLAIAGKFDLTTLLVTFSSAGRR